MARMKTNRESLWWLARCGHPSERRPPEPRPSGSGGCVCGGNHSLSVAARDVGQRGFRVWGHAAAEPVRPARMQPFQPPDPVECHGGAARNGERLGVSPPSAFFPRILTQSNSVAFRSQAIKSRGCRIAGHVSPRWADAQPLARRTVRGWSRHGRFHNRHHHLAVRPASKG
jgi:hypothetical protein